MSSGSMAIQRFAKVLDAGGTQTNNPRYARFAFHAAGMKESLNLVSFPLFFHVAPIKKVSTFEVERKIKS